jgi:DNA repair exonuclease SbcCD ATPase subunit
MTSAEIEVTELKKLATDKYDYIQKLHLLKDGFKEIKSYVFNNVIGELQLKSNEYAAKLFEIPVYIKFTNEDMKIGVTVKLDSQERSLSLLSGGQFRRVSLAVDLALSDIVLSRKNSRLNLIAMDEPFQNLSESSMQKCVEVFSQLDKPLLLIEHNSVAKSVVNNTVFVEYRNGTSHV